jgi:hypothetical protein
MPRAKGKIRPRGTPPKTSWLGSLPEEDDIDSACQPAARDLLDWQPRIRHEPDERQLRLDLAEPAQGREAAVRAGFTPWW